MFLDQFALQHLQTKMRAYKWDEDIEDGACQFCASEKGYKQTQRVRPETNDGTGIQKRI